MPPVAVTTVPMLDVPPVLPPPSLLPAHVDAPPAPTVMLWLGLQQPAPPSSTRRAFATAATGTTGGAAATAAAAAGLHRLEHHVTAADEGV